MSSWPSVPPDPPPDIVKVVADVGPDDPFGMKTERLWAAPLGDHLLRLYNTPWHARGLNWGDVVRCDGQQILDVVEWSGHLSCSVYFFAGAADAERERVIAELNGRGASYEWYSPAEGTRLYAIDIPREADWRNVFEFLEAEDANETLAFQTSWGDDLPHPRAG